MAWSLANYLLDHNVRLRRHNWGGGGTQMLAQELFSLFSGIQRSADAISSTDQNGNPLTIPTINLPQINPGDFDFAFPNSPLIDPPVITNPQSLPNPNNPQLPDPTFPESENGAANSSQTRWYRYVFPAHVLERREASSNSQVTFTLRTYKNGFLHDEGGPFTPVRVRPTQIDPASADESPDEEPFVEERAIEEVEAILTDANLADNVEIGSWTWVFMAVQMEFTTNPDGTQEVKAVQGPQYIFHAPPTLAGMAFTTSPIAAKNESTNQPGEGTATLKYRVDGEWRDGESVTLFNQTSSEVESDRWVQLKTIGGLRFVDVEDCSG